MKTNKQTVNCWLWIVLFILPTGWASAAECRRPIPWLGGSTAILRNEDLSTPDKLKEIVKNPKYQKAFMEILAKAHLAGNYNELMKTIDDLTQDKLESYPPGTKFEWMAYRRKSDKKIGLLHNSCWAGSENIWAWTFNLTIEGKPHAFILPVKCLNLAPLKKPRYLPPACRLSASALCSPSPSTITVTAVVQTHGGVGVKEVDFSATLPGGPQAYYSTSNEPYVWTLPIEKGGTYSFSAMATDDKKMISPACTAQVTVCEKEKIIYCTPPSCHLTVTWKWLKESGKGSLGIVPEVQNAASSEINVDGTLAANGDRSIEVPISETGSHTVKLIAYPTASPCQPATCTTTVQIPPPPQPCCARPWLLRAAFGWAESQGSKATGTFSKAGQDEGTYQFNFQQGPGFGLELEHLFGTAGPWDTAKLGWTLSAFETDMNTRWVLDTPQRWIVDHDRVPVLTLTTGVNYHWRKPKWDLHAGPVVGLARFGDASFADNSVKPGTFRANFDTAFVYGAGLGFDAFLGNCWGLTGGVEYLKFQAKTDWFKVDVDPLTFKAGIVYRF